MRNLFRFRKSTILTNKKLPSKKEGYVNGVQLQRHHDPTKHKI
jgi:hypothetical protein